MASAARSLSSFLVVVGFLVLTALAAILYGGNAAQQEKMKQNIFWQGARYVSDAALSAITGASSLSWSQNTAVGQKITETASQADLNELSLAGLKNNIPSDISGNNDLWSSWKERLAREWPNDNTGQNNLEAGGIKWERMATGAEIIYTSKSGEEHKLPLPFKFLGR